MDRKMYVFEVQLKNFLEGNSGGLNEKEDNGDVTSKYL